MVGSLKIYVPGPGGYQQIDGSKFYDARYWEPEKYQQWHDANWQQPRIGRVTVGEVEQTDGPAVDSRVPATAPDVDAAAPEAPEVPRSEEHTSELQSLMRISYAVFCLKQKRQQNNTNINTLLTH